MFDACVGGCRGGLLIDIFDHTVCSVIVIFPVLSSLSFLCLRGDPSPLKVCNSHTLNVCNSQLGILKFVDLVKYKTSIIMFKAYHNILPDSLQKMFNLRVQIYDTRQKCTFTVHRAHTNVKSMCISIYGVKLWNLLHTDLTNSRSLQVFKNMYKLHIISLY